MKMFELIILAVLAVSVQGDVCNFDCSGLPDGDYPCTTDCNKFIMCANGYAYEMSCGVGLMYNYKSDACDWPYQIPDDSDCLNGGTTETPSILTTTTKAPTTSTTTTTTSTTTTTTTTTTSTTTTTTTSTTTSTTTTSTTTTSTTSTTTIPDVVDRCFDQDCPILDDGTIADHAIYGYAKNCSFYFECNMNVTCIKLCQPGLQFDKDNLICVLPAQLNYTCIDRDNVGFFHIYHETFENAHFIQNPSMMNMPECSRDLLGECNVHFQPIYGSLGAWDDPNVCSNEFTVCQNGWTCRMRCDEGYRVDVERKRCMRKERIQC